MKTIQVYSPEELKEINPDGFERAYQWFRNGNNDIPWTDEIMDSLKALFDASGISLRDWSIDAYGYSYVKFDMESDVEELQGQRALAWIENNLLSDLRIPFVPMFINFDGWKTTPRRGELSKYGKYYRAGMIKPCPFTGYCADEDFIDALIEAVKDGETLKDAYSSLANVASKLFESEIKQANSEEEFLIQDHLQFTEDGHIV